MDDYRIKKYFEYKQSQLKETQEKALAQAIKNQDEEAAAQLVRSIRNTLLDESDKEVTLDRVNLDFSNAINFLSSLKEFLSKDWIIYRQKLRDITEQEGFPFNVIFPEKPNKESQN